MTAEIRVDTIKSRAGINTISLNNNTLFFGSNVGIGTTNAGEALQVDGNIRVGASTQSNYIAFRGTNFDGNPATGLFSSYTHTYIGERIYDYSATNSERSELLLFKGNDVVNNFGPDRIRLVAGEHRFDVLGLGGTFGAGTFEQVGLTTAAINVVAITTTGIGIGTTSPTQKIEINSNTFGGLRINTNSEYPAFWLAQNGDNKWSITSNLNGDSGFVIRESGVADRLNIKPGGGIGIGTTNPISASSALHINGASYHGSAGDALLRLVSIGGINYIQSGINALSDSSAALVFGTIFAGSEWARFTPSGNFGIGVNNPSFRLDVTGAVRLGVGVTQGSPSLSSLVTNTHTLLGGQGGNYLAVGQYGASSNYAQWVQSSFITPSTTTYDIVLQPLGGNVGVGSTIPNAKVAVAGSITELSQGQYWNVVTQSDVGIGASQVPLNQYLGQLAFLDEYSPNVLLTPRIQSVGERTTRISGNTASLSYNTGGGNIAICTNPTGDITLAVTGIPTTSDFDDTSLTFSVCVNQTGTARSCTAVTLNGFNATIRWAGGSITNAISGVTTTSGMDIYSFTGINTVGSASTTANYYVLGVVNGGYR